MKKFVYLSKNYKTVIIITMKKLYLVRHAQSNANINPIHLQATPNPAVDLSAVGYSQAAETGKFLATQVNTNSVLWNSPYYRTRRTAEAIEKELYALSGVEIIKRESIYLAERQFGLVDDVPNYTTAYKHEHAHYNFFQEHKVGFFARPPLGESPFDLCLRLDTFINTEIETSQYDCHIIVSHGAALKAALMMALRWEYEKYDQERNSVNAGVRLLEKEGHEWRDRGYVFTPKVKTS